MRLILVLLLGLASLSSFAEVQSTELDLFDKKRDRPVKIRVWYQAGSDCLVKLCINKAVKQKKLSVALISHGAFGSPREMNWLGLGLASEGWLAIGVAHYGESWVYGRETVDYASISKKWLRSQDISFVLDQLFAGTVTETPIADDKITVFGHSLGGYSALSLVGADYNIDAMFEYCKSAITTDRGCRYGSSKGKQVEHINTVSEVDVFDERVAAVVSLDPALGPSVSKESLININVPTLIVGSVENDFLNYSAHANYYASTIKGAKLIALNEGEGHFVYLDKCDHPHQAIGVSLCKDKSGIDRTKVHTHLMSEITRFINQL